MNRLKDIETRMKEIGVEIDTEDSDLDKLEKELDTLKEERTGIVAKAEKRKKLMDNVASMENTVTLESHQKEERDGKSQQFGIESIEYRNAFLKNLLGEPLTEIEERAYSHTTANTGAVVPKDLQDKIYSNMEESHPVLKDVNVLRTGTVIQIGKHVSIVDGDAKEVLEGMANADEANDFVSVTLSGKDFSKHVDFSYRMGNVAIPAFEQYLVKEIGDRIGSAMAADVVLQIKNDLIYPNKYSAETGGTVVMADVMKGLGKLKGTGKVFVYANNSTFYNNIATMENADNRLSFIPNYEQSVSGQLVGKGIKEEDALAEGEVLFLDPSQFVYNMVQDVMLERDKDIKKHVHTISGFAIAEGTMTNDKGGSLLTVGMAI